MSYNIKGITVEINGDTTKLREELNKVKAETSGLTKAMKTMTNALKVDPSNIENLQLQAELTQTKMQSLAKQLNLVNEGIKQFPQTVEQWKSRLAEIEQEQARIQQAYYDQMTSLSQLTTESEALASAESRRNDIVNSYKSTLQYQTADAQAAYQQLQQQVALYDQQAIVVARAEEEMQAQQATLAEMEAQLTQLVAEWEIQDNVVKTHQTALASAEAELAKMNADVTGLNAQQAEQEALVQALTAEYMAESQALLDIEATMGAASNEYARQELVVDQIVAELSIEEEKLTALKVSVEEATAKYNAQVAVIKNITREIEEQESLLKVAEHKVGEQTKAYDQQLEKVKRIQTQLSSEQSELEKIEASVGKASKEYSTQATKVGTIQKALAEEEAELEKIKTDISDSNAKITVCKSSLNSLGKEFNTLNKESTALKNNIANAPQQLAAAKVESAKLVADFNQLASISLGNNAGLISLYGTLGKVSTNAEKAYQALKNISLISGIGIVASVASAASFEDAWAGVLKTVNGTDEQLESVNEGLQELAKNTASSYQDIAGYAEVAGQMGIATDDVVEFTRVITELNDTTNLTGETAAENLAKIKNIFNGAEEMEMDYYSKMGSAIVDLGNNFATTEDDIVSMTEVMASYTSQAGFNEQQTLALATTLSSLGIEANAGGSSMGQLVKKIDNATTEGGDLLASFAETAGMSAEQFAEAWKNEPMEAFTALISGMGTVDNLNSTLSDLGITNIRVTRATKSLANASDLLTEALNTSNTAWEQNTAMDEEAAKRYSTTVSQLKELWEAVKQVAAELGEAFLPTLKNIVSGLKDFADRFTEMDEGTRNFIATVLTITTVTAPLLKVISGVSSGGQALIKMFTSGTSKATTFANVLGLGETALGKFLNTMSKTEGVNVDKTLDAAAVSGGRLNTSFQALFQTLKNKSAISSLTNPLQKLGATMTANLGTTLGLTAALAACVYQAKVYESEIQEELAAESDQYAIAQKLIEQNDEYNTSMEEHRSTAKEYAQSIEDNAKAADTYMESLESMMAKETKSSATIDLMKSTVEKLNELYPNLGWSVDEATGNILDNTGAVIDNTTALENNLAAVQAESMAEAYKSAGNEISESIVEQKKNQSDLKAEISSTEAELEKYTKAFNEAAEADSSYASSAEGSAASRKVIELADALKDLKQSESDAGDALKELTAEQAEYANAAESGDLNKFGETLQKRFEALQVAAEECGIKIPQEIQAGLDGGDVDVSQALMWQSALSEFGTMTDIANSTGVNIDKELMSGILNDATDVQSSIDMLNNMMTYEGLLASAKDAGYQIPEDLSAGMNASATDITTATQGLANYLNFQDALTVAGESGDKITAEIANGLLNGTMTLQQAAQQVGITLPDGMKDGENEAIEGADETVEKIKSDLEANGDLNAEGTNMGSTFAKGLDDQMVKAVESFKTYIEEIRTAASKGISVDVTVNKKTTSSDDKDGDAHIGTLLHASQRGQYLKGMASESPYIDTSSYLSTQAGNNAINGITFDTSALSKMSAKLDGVIDALLDTKFVVQLQPQELDGSVLTDTVEKITTIRNMMSNLGKGVA